MKELWKDGGYKSRKLWFAVFAVTVLFAGMAYVIKHAASSAIYDIFVTGVVGIAALLMTGNVAAKFVATKAPPTTTIKKMEPDEEPTTTPAKPQDPDLK